MMQPYHEPDELIEVLEAGYAAPPLDAAFSDNLVRRMQAEVLAQSSVPRKRHARWAVVLCGAGVAASILAVIYVSNPLGTKASRDEFALQSVPGSSFELSSSIESKSTGSLETASIPTSHAEIDGGSAINESLVDAKSGEAVAETSISESKLESRTDLLKSLVKNPASKATSSNRTSSNFESMSEAVMEEFEIVTKERAKALGLSIKSQTDGPDAVRVSVEFEKQAELKEYIRVELKQYNGDKLMLSVTLKEGESKSGRVIVGFVAARSNLTALSLEIVSKDASRSRVRYVLPMKDFVTKPEGLKQL